MTSLYARALSLLALMAFQSIPVNAQTIDTRPPNFNPIGFGFGDPFIATMGQTILATPTQTHLTDFTFLVAPARNPDDVTFRAYVSAWDGANVRATGPILFVSDPMSTVGAPLAPTFTEYPVTIPGGLDLSPGSTYVLFLSASEFIDSMAGVASFGLRNDDPYAAGEFVFLSNVADTSLWTTATWSRMNRVDVAFQARFRSQDVVPENGSFVLMGTGLVPFWIAMWKRRKRS